MEGLSFTYAIFLNLELVDKRAIKRALFWGTGQLACSQTEKAK